MVNLFILLKIFFTQVDLLSVWIFFSYKFVKYLLYLHIEDDNAILGIEEFTSVQEMNVFFFVIIVFGNLNYKFSV